MKLEFKERQMPGDGNCLYHSLGQAFKIDQQSLRNKISDYLLKNGDKKINGMMMREWVRLEKDMSLDMYSDVMRRSGIWGGNMEIMSSSQIYRVNIFILGRENGKYKIVSSYVWHNDARNIFLMYNGVHYNYLEVVKNIGGIKT